MSLSTNPYVLKKRSGIHGFGLFAKTDISQGTKIIEYVGEKITKAESDRRGPKLVEYAKNHHELGAVYIFELNQRYDIDGHVDYNAAKFINHSCDPNCEAEIIRGHIWIRALRDLKKGEELFYNYGYSLDTFEDHPCRCGTDRCVGFIVEETYWPQLKRLLARKQQG